MNINRGEIVGNRLKTKYDIADLVRLTGYHRNSFTLWFAQPDLDLKIILLLQKKTGFDFSDEIPELKGARLNHQGILIMMEPSPEYATLTMDELKDAMLNLQGKYISLQEENAELKKEIALLSQQLTTNHLPFIF